MKLLVITNSIGENLESGSAVFCEDLIQCLRSNNKLKIVASGSVPGGIEASDDLLRIDRLLTIDPDELRSILSEHIRVRDYDLVYNLGALQFGCAVTNLLREIEGNFPLVNHFQVILGAYANSEGLTDELQEFNSNAQREAASAALMNIFISDAELRQAFLSGFDLTGSHVAVVPNGLDPALLRKMAASSLTTPVTENNDARPIVFATAGRFSDYAKGADLVYRAFGYLYGCRQDVFLLSITDGPRFSDILEALPTNSYRIMEWLTRQEFLAQLAAADVIVVPSRYEAFGLVALEAMLLQKPVIATATGGLQSVVEHGRTGLLTAPGDGSFGLFQAMLTLANSPELRAQMGKEGRARALREYKISRIASLVDNNLRRARLHNRSFSQAGLHL